MMVFMMINFYIYCIPVRQMSDVLARNRHVLNFEVGKNVNFTNNIYGLTCKATESAIKYGAEVATACDPVAAAIALGGKIGVGASLSKFSASQCAGLIGVIVSSITPQVIKL